MPKNIIQSVILDGLQTAEDTFTFKQDTYNGDGKQITQGGVVDVDVGKGCAYGKNAGEKTA